MLATNDVGRRMSDMSGRSSQDTVDSQGENTLGSTEENQIIPPPPAPPRRRVRCLLPMLLAMFLVLVGVVATPVVVFVLDGNGELPFFGKKNETTVAELSLASITQTATPKASGAAASPMDGPQERIVALTTPPRPKSSHVTPAGSAAGSRYHAAPHHKSDSNRERVYAPTVGGTASRTTIGATAEVQALSEQVIVVPKGGVMSKLRAAGAADSAAAKALRKARLPKSSHSEVNISEQRDDNNATSTMTTGNHTAKPNRKLTETLKPETMPELVPSDDWRDSSFVNDTLANKRSLATANDTIPNDEKKFVDFTNERREDNDIEDTGNKSYIKTANDNRELDYSSRETTAQPDSGVGVDYYDDNKNETSPSGSAEADDSHGEPKTRNRRISGEISVPTKSSKKPDVFQTEYYYDDSPSRKTEESTTQDITEPGYESVPEQEAIDELFS
ncbi:uncharacterized protein LOC119391612 [Rhipicephalus sanguineus]|uniref:uncharacterized protein LOC119391612 n=1 Tax=Rhipicephalus sanguineus TaxID=34632 RepID=UPI001894A114|nr:uncharacterized protein LOC119391612 [Rhipicephalus sanguineus]